MPCNKYQVFLIKFAKNTIMLFIKLLKNKYFLVSIFFIVWMLFVDNNNFITAMRFKKELKTLKDEKVFYESEIKINKEKLNKLQNDKSAMMDLAREKYLMKKDNEDIFLLVYE